MKKLYIYFNHFIDNPFLKGFPKGGGGYLREALF